MLRKIWTYFTWRKLMYQHKKELRKTFNIKIDWISRLYVLYHKVIDTENDFVTQEQLKKDVEIYINKVIDYLNRLGCVGIFKVKFTPKEEYDVNFFEKIKAFHFLIVFEYSLLNIPRIIRRIIRTCALFGVGTMFYLLFRYFFLIN